MNFERFFNNLNAFGKIGMDDDGGINRLAFSEAYFEAIEKMNNYASEKGFKTRQDKVGNLFISYNPKSAKKYLMLGSHMDTVKSGGLYDGALGVIAGLEVLESLRDREILTKYGIILAAFNAEEGSEMGGTFGSRTITGRNNLVDESLPSKIRTYGLRLEDLEDSIIDFKEIVGFLELHIEQGGVLDKEEIDIGVVDGIVGITRYNIVVRGEANHAGTTPMYLRNDPIRKLPQLIEGLYELTNKYSHPFVMTIGDIKVRPGMYNIIPGEVEILIEVRDMEQGNINEFFREVKLFLDTDIEGSEIFINIDKPSVYLDKEYMDIVSKTCQKLGYSYKKISSGAGHDAKGISNLVPSSLIFVPSVDGVSHSPKEYTHEGQLEKGIKVLLETVISIAGDDEN